MKKIFTFIVALVATTALWAYDCKVDGIYYNLNSTDLTAEVTKDYNIYSCYSGSITIPSSINYKSKTYSVTAIGGAAFYWCSDLTSVTIPNSVTTIGDHVFSYCSGLTSITIPNSVTTIGEEAFSSCPGLTSVTIPNSVTTIESHAFAYCFGLTSITISNSVTTIEDYTFSSCFALTSVTIGNSVTTIGEEAFSWCESLTSVTIPNSVTTISKRAFADCSALTSVTIPNSVITIGNEAFYGCKGLTSVTIPNSVTTIGDEAFACCWRMTSITCYAITPPKCGVEVFYPDAKVYVYVLASALADYQSAYYWKDMQLYPIAAEVTPMDDDNPIVTPSDQDVTITWPITDGTDTYTLTITKNGEVICVLTFKANGQLKNIAYAAPGRDGAHQAPAATLTAQGYQFTVTGLDRATKYGLGLAVKDKEGQVIKTYTGAFATTGYVPQNYTIAVNANDDVMGRVTGSGTFEELSSATITAIPNEHYHFVQWNDGNTNNPRQIIVEEDKTYTAIFSIDQHIISATTEHGIVSGAGIYDYGKEVTLTATPNEGYEFVNWSNGITANPYTFTVEQDIELTAKFKEIETGWQDIHSGINATKFFHNGNLIIERNGVKYTATGQKVR